MSDFSTRLGRLRATRGLTLSELARRSGVDKGNLARLEAGTAKAPTLETAKRLAQALRVPLSTLAAAPAVTAPIRLLEPAVLDALDRLHVPDPAALVARLAALDPVDLDQVIAVIGMLERGEPLVALAAPPPAAVPAIRVLGGPTTPRRRP